MTLRRTGVALVLLAGCAAPAGLDRQENTVDARTCLSLLERAVLLARAEGNDTTMVFGDTPVDLYDDPDEFYSAVEEGRPPDRFAGDVPTGERRSKGIDLLSQCRPDG
ncbi:MAG: hypothetical protein ACRD0U_20810 [Acidimicrobiales bacterium]